MAAPRSRTARHAFEILTATSWPVLIVHRPESPTENSDWRPTHNPSFPRKAGIQGPRSERRPWTLAFRGGDDEWFVISGSFSVGH
jgi:hypothetical protein